MVGDNDDNKRGVRDIRSDHQGEIKQMYSLLAIKARVKPPPSLDFIPPDVRSISVSHFLPSETDLAALRCNLVVLVSRFLCDYIKVLKPHKRSVAEHILHAHSFEMADKSEVVVLDFLHKNETKSADMIDIMKRAAGLLG